MADVQYSENGKVAMFNGLRFIRDDSSGYYLNSTRRLRLHRAVYEFHYGTIPEGYDIHHIDFDKENNEVSNLQLLTSAEHMKIHGENLSDERKAIMRENLLANALPAAADWHKSDAGRDWHKVHYLQTRDRMKQKRQITCRCCQKEFQGYANSIFCSERCRGRWRRMTGITKTRRNCEICGKEFITSKYSGTRTCSASCANRLRWGKAHHKAS